MAPRDVITIGTEPPPEPRLHWVVPTAVLVFVVVVLVLIGAFGRSSTRRPGDAVPDQVDAALAVVEDFTAHWNKGDAPAVVALIADDWGSVALPGLIDGALSPDDGRDALSDSVGFLTSVARLSLGDCRADLAPPGSLAAVSVHCEQARFAGHYLDAVRRNIWEGIRPGDDIGGGVRVPGLRFHILGGRIVSLEGDPRLFTPQAYCVWAEHALPRVADALFDLQCRPIALASTGELHASAAEAFMEAGAPVPSRPEAEARLAAGYVDRFVTHHNLGDTGSARGWLSTAVSPSDLPGYVGGVAPGMSSYLRWSSQVMQFAAGTCTVDVEAILTFVTCPDFEVAGLLHRDSVPQPTRFALSGSNIDGRPARAYGRIVEVERLGDTVISVEEVCSRVRASRPDVVAEVFTESCDPVYTSAAAATLATVLDTD